MYGASTCLNDIRCSDAALKKKSLNIGNISWPWTTNFHRQKSFVCIVWVVVIESREELYISCWLIHCIKFTWYTLSVQLNPAESSSQVSWHLPLFKIILAPGGRVSTPALMASKACSSGVGTSVHVILINPCWQMVSSTSDTKRCMEFFLTAIFPTVTLEAVPPSCVSLFSIWQQLLGWTGLESTYQLV